MSWTHEQQRSKLNNQVANLQERKFYGKVTLDIQGGNLLRSITEESEKYADPESKCGDPSNEAFEDGGEDQEATAQAESTHQKA